MHVYTSPHLAHFNERIRLAGALIAEERLAETLERCEAANAGAPITFFEITTAAAFLAMAETPADFALLEVGLGGRLDATNVIDRPRMTVITPVSLDHQQYLGETLAEIAGEKAGILKHGILGIVGRQEPEALAVIEARAARMVAPLMVEGQDWQVWEEHGRLAFLDAQRPARPAAAGAPRGAPGGERRHRAGGAPRARHRRGRLRRGADPGRVAGAAAAAAARAAGRGGRRGAELWLDGGHNPAAGVALAEALGRLPPRPLHLVVGHAAHQGRRGLPAPRWRRGARSLRAVSIPGEAATLTAAETVAAARGAGFADAAPAADVAEAVAAISAAAPEGRILICGSLYLAGRVLRENG